ncbi:hypothetical protein [Brevundimonas nasdae]|uniref:hypothetical protein n=1 Tax=Brevundimonas nasdae TaxID=172043 RepID=UPI002898D28F|nr:hypothetical protein [Brevundimonas nasdae]
MSGPVIDFDWLRSLHQHKRLHLTTSQGMAGTVHMGGSAEAMVSHLIRLAEVGQKLEMATAAAVRVQHR